MKKNGLSLVKYHFYVKTRTMDFLYQPYLLESLVPHEPLFELDLARLYPDNPSDIIHWFDSQNHKKNLFYNYLRIPIIVQPVSEDNRHNIYIKDLIKKNIVSAFDFVFSASERNENWHLAEKLLNLVSNNSFDIYDASPYFEKDIQDKSEIFHIEAYENAYLFTPKFPSIAQAETEEEMLLIKALSRRILFLKRLGVLDFIKNTWKVNNNELNNYDSGMAKLLSIFMDAKSSQIRNVLKDINRDPAESAKQEMQETWDKIKISKKN